MPGLQDDLVADELRTALNNALRDLARAKARTEDLIAATQRAAHDALVAEFTKPSTIKPDKDARRHRPEVALWHLTDWQGGKQTVSYNRQIMAERVHRFVDKVQRITDIQRADHPVRECVILFGGDMLEGLFQFPTQVFEVDATIFQQWTFVSRLCADVVRRALGIHDSVYVVSEWGNHGRIGSKRDAIPRADNLDRMIYETARLILGNEDRLTWLDSAEDIQRVEIGNYRALLMHGDERGRNGYVAATTFLGYLNQLKAGAFGWDFRDVYSGHYHSHNDRAMSDGRGEWFQTGSTESDNRYARDGLGANSQPSQRLHFVDPDKGRITARYKVELDDQLTPADYGEPV